MEKAKCPHPQIYIFRQSYLIFEDVFDRRPLALCEIHLIRFVQSVGYSSGRGGNPQVIANVFDQHAVFLPQLV